MKSKTIMRPKRSAAELQDIWKHVVYEIHMLMEAGRFLSTFKADQSSDSDRVTQNVFIESFAIHARALMAFLYPCDPRPDDVIADDFFADPSIWRSKRPHMTDTLKRIGPRVGKEVAHLTYARTEVMPEEKDWPFARIVVEIDLALREFTGLLPDDFNKPATHQVPMPSVLPHASTTGVTIIVTEVGSKNLG